MTRKPGGNEVLELVKRHACTVAVLTSKLICALVHAPVVDHMPIQFTLALLLSLGPLPFNLSWWGFWHDNNIVANELRGKAGVDIHVLQALF